MNNTITITQSLFEKMLSRIERLEKAVFRRDSSVFKSVATYESEKEQGKLKKMKSVDELFD